MLRPLRTRLSRTSYASRVTVPKNEPHKQFATRMDVTVAAYHPTLGEASSEKGIIYMNLRAGSSSGKGVTFTTDRL